VVFIKVRTPRRRKPCDVHSRRVVRCDTVDGRTALVAATAAPERELAQQALTEWVRIDGSYVGSRAGDFKLLRNKACH
jgi:hypothetical protein